MLYNYTYFLSDLSFYVHLFYPLFIGGGGGTYLFPSLPHFLIIPDFEEKQYLELTHSLQIDDKLV